MVPGISIRTGAASGAAGAAPVGLAGHEVGHGGADRDSADVVPAGEGGDAGADAECLPDFRLDAELRESWPPSGARAVGAGGREAVAGEFVLQVALELPDRDQHVDQHGGGRVPGGQVDDAGERPGQHPQPHLAGAAPIADGEDVGQVPAEPVELGHGQPVPGAGVAGQLAEPGALERRDFRRGRRVSEQPHPAGGAGEPGLGEQVGLALRALLVGGHPRVDQLRHQALAPSGRRARPRPRTTPYLSSNPVVMTHRIALDSGGAGTAVSGGPADPVALPGGVSSNDRFATPIWVRCQVRSSAVGRDGARCWCALSDDGVGPDPGG